MRKLVKPVFIRFLVVIIESVVFFLLARLNIQ